MSPDQNARALTSIAGAHNQQVMSPSGSAQPSVPPFPTAAGPSAQFGGIQFMQATRLEIPTSILQQFAQAASLDASMLHDLRAAVIELNDRMQYRSNVLGDACVTLHSGYNAIVDNLDRLQQGMEAHSRTLAFLMNENLSLKQEIESTGEQLSTDMRQQFAIVREQLSAVQIKAETAMMGPQQWQAQVEAHIVTIQNNLEAGLRKASSENETLRSRVGVLEQANQEREREWQTLRQEHRASADQKGCDSTEVRTQVDELCATMTDHGQRLDVISRDVADLHASVAEVESSVSHLEGHSATIREEIRGLHQICEHFAVYTDEEPVVGDPGMEDYEAGWWGQHNDVDAMPQGPPPGFGDQPLHPPGTTQIPRRMCHRRRKLRSCQNSDLQDQVITEVTRASITEESEGVESIPEVCADRDFREEENPNSIVWAVWDTIIHDELDVDETGTIPIAEGGEFRSGKAACFGPDTAPTKGGSSKSSRCRVRLREGRSTGKGAYCGPATSTPNIIIIVLFTRPFQPESSCSPGKQHWSSQVRLTLADGNTTCAWRTRDGELAMPGDETSWIVPVGRLVQLGYRFVWDLDLGARLVRETEAGCETIHMFVDNGLPYIYWSDFAHLRKQLSAAFRNQKRSCCAVASNESELMNMFVTPDDLHECEAEAKECVSPDSKACIGEQVAAAFLKLESITYDHVLEAVMKAGLKPQSKSRSCAVGLEGSEGIKSWVFGAYGHGPHCGVTTRTNQFPNLVALINRFMQQEMPAASWSSFTISQDVTFTPHKDTHNEPDSLNVLVVLNHKGQCKGGSLWIEQEDGDQMRQIKPDLNLRGVVMPVLRRPVQFSPTKWHGTTPWKGTRVALSFFTTRNVLTLPADEQRRLKELHFPTCEAVAAAAEHIAFPLSLNPADDQFPEDLEAKTTDATVGEGQFRENVSDEFQDGGLFGDVFQGLADPDGPPASSDMWPLDDDLAEYEPSLADPEDIFHASQFDDQPGEASSREFALPAAAPEAPKAVNWQKYHLLSYEEEQLANQVEEKLLEASTAPAQAETVDLKGFYKGDRQQQWKASLVKEYGKMKDVLEEATRDQLHGRLGLPAGTRLPREIPSKVVATLKPSEDPTLANEDGFAEKSRICACGNFESGADNNGEPWTSSNIPPEIVRTFVSLAASTENWTLGGLDVEAAFLNADISSGDPVIITPPKVMRDLGLVGAETVWIARKNIYGLRRGPTEWEKERDTKINHATIQGSKGDNHSALTFIPINLAAGLWKLVDEKGVVVGACCCYVDDGLVVGDVEVIRRVTAFIQSLWSIKGQGILEKPGVGLSGNLVVSETLTLKLVRCMRFLGAEIAVASDGLQIGQAKYVAQELRARGWLTLKGSESLPVPSEGLAASEIRDNAFEANMKLAQKEAGTLMWIALRSRPDIAACLGVASTLITSRPSESLRLCKGIWRYLRSTWDKVIQYNYG
ncbi:unnamed protein product, partial [Symbiodinium sp. CCMP2592]